MSADDAFLDEYRQLKSWLLAYAYPLWWERGADRENGGFHERLALDAVPTGEPRRARLHPRQIYSFSAAKQLGWDGPSEEGVRHALTFFRDHYFRDDGLIRAAVDERGRPQKEAAVLYDQAFGLLGFAAAFATFRDECDREAAHVLRREIVDAFGRAQGFEENLNRTPPLLANSHMHLLEACLAWREFDGAWDGMAEAIVELALDRLFDERVRAIPEFFDREWRPVQGELGRVVEPGHQFEWAWLLLRWASIRQDAAVSQRAVQLIDASEAHVHARRQVAMNSLIVHDATLIVRDADARLWPQTERLKANLLAARATGDRRYVDRATRALQVLQSYLRVPTAGLWRDSLKADGTFVEEAAPASSFYHIVCAAQECELHARLRFGADA